MNNYCKKRAVFYCLRQEQPQEQSVGLQQALAVQGLGIVGLSALFVRQSRDADSLQRVLPDWCLPPTGVWCVTPGRRLLPKRTSAFIQILTEVLAEGGAAPAPLAAGHRPRG